MSPAELPAALEAERQSYLTSGRVDALTRAAQALADRSARLPTLVLYGESGVGKTRALAFLADALSTDGLDVAYAGAPETVVEPYGPIYDAMPQLRVSVDADPPAVVETPGAGSPLSPEWVASPIPTVPQLLELLQPDRPLVIVVDDAQWLDSRSSEFLEALRGAPVADQVALVVATRDVDELSPTLRRGLMGQRTVDYLALEPLELSDVAEIVADRFGEATSTLRSRLADDLKQKSGGLPFVIQSLIPLVDGSTCRMRDVVLTPGSDPLQALVARLPPDIRRVGSFAAVLGSFFELKNLIELCDLPERTVRAAARALVELDDLHGRDDRDDTVLWFKHALLESAFYHQLAADDRYATHRAAADVVDDVHQRARHERLSAQLGEAPEAALALSASAYAYAAKGAFQETIQELEAAAELPNVELDRQGRELLATARYRVGADESAEALRTRLFDEAIAAGDHRSALRSIRIGLPEAERVDGDRVRLQHLLTVDHTVLAPDERFQHATLLVRQATLTGRAELAREWLAQAERLASTPDQRAEVALSGWYCFSLVEHPETRLARTDRAIADPELSDLWTARLRQLRAIDHYETGDLAAADDDYQQLGDYAARSRDRLRQWHHLVFCTMQAFDAGRWTEASQYQAAAVRLADHHAIVEGEAAFLVQVFHESWLKGRLGELKPVFDDLPTDLARARPGRAARVSCLHQLGDIEAAVPIGAELVGEILAAPNQDSANTLAYLAPFIASTLGTDEVAGAFDLLARRAGASIVFGAGICCAGPADRYLYQLTGDLEHLARAIDVADDAGLRIWQVMLRREYPDSELMARQADQLAIGTDLMDLVPPSL